jgi:transposase
MSGEARVAERRRWNARQKLDIVLEARQAGRTVLEVCRRHEISSSLFYAWERQACQGAIAALEQGSGRQARSGEATARAELERMRVLVADLTAENLQLRRRLPVPHHRSKSEQEEINP